MPHAPATPLEAHDPDRARALKTKIRDRISDVRRHLVALRAGMAEFGGDFDLDAFQAAYDSESEDPIELNRVKAVERGVDQLYNYIAELTAFGLELAEIRTRGQETNARRDLDALARIGVIGPERNRRLQRLRELRHRGSRRSANASLTHIQPDCSALVPTSSHIRNQAERQQVVQVPAKLRVLRSSRLMSD